MQRHILSTFVLYVSILMASDALAACDATADRYYELARKARKEFREQDALQFLDRAAQACSRYQYWQELGELAAGFAEKETRSRAAEAYVEAYALASSPAEQARSAARYAELLLAEEDPQRAAKYAYYAKDLAPSDPRIQALAERITDRLGEARPDDIKRGLGDAYLRPLQLASIASTAAASAARAVASKPAATARSTKTISIPINFEFDSVEVDARTSNNVTVLAKALADPQYKSKRFMFIGHTDARGTPDYNRNLSKRRSDAIYEQVIKAQPELSDRIATMGKGMDTPLTQGTTEDDNRINRRLEVVLLE
jgi:outer membrane protein OmpA-like peptidoglycan-associated protein